MATPPASILERRSGNALTDTAHLWKRQLKRYFSNPLRIIALLIRPLIWLLLFGVAMGSVVPKIHGYSYAVYVLPGLVAMSVLASASRGGQTLLRDKGTGFLREVLVAPVSRPSILMGFTLGITTRSLINAFLTVLAGFLIGASLGDSVLSVIGNILALIAILSLLSLALVSLSVALAWRIDDMVTYSTVSGWFFYPLFFLSGALYKVAGLPWILKTLISLNPLTYGVDAVRQIMLGQQVGAFYLWADVAAVVAFAAVCLGFALWTLTRPASTDV